MDSFNWLKEKNKISAWKMSEVVLAYNEISTKYNELQASSDLMKGKNAHLSKKLKEADAIIFMREAEHRKVE